MSDSLLVEEAADLGLGAARHRGLRVLVRHHRRARATPALRLPLDDLERDRPVVLLPAHEEELLRRERHEGDVPEEEEVAVAADGRAVREQRQARLEPDPEGLQRGDRLSGRRGDARARVRGEERRQRRHGRLQLRPDPRRGPRSRASRTAPRPRRARRAPVPACAGSTRAGRATSSLRSLSNGGGERSASTTTGTVWSTQNIGSRRHERLTSSSQRTRASAEPISRRSTCHGTGRAGSASAFRRSSKSASVLRRVSMDSARPVGRPAGAAGRRGRRRPGSSAS